MILLFKLLVSHALCDYPLQGDFLAKAKNHKNGIIGVPFYIPLVCHSLIHSGGVYFCTGNIHFAFTELFLHTIIDYFKCDGAFGFQTDQILHVICKLIYLL